MSDEPTKERDLTDEELEAQDAEELPDRETMMILDPGPGPMPVASDLEPVPWPDGPPEREAEAPDDRYEQ